MKLKAATFLTLALTSLTLASITGCSNNIASEDDNNNPSQLSEGDNNNPLQPNENDDNNSSQPNEEEVGQSTQALSRGCFWAYMEMVNECSNVNRFQYDCATAYNKYYCICFQNRRDC